MKKSIFLPGVSLLLLSSALLGPLGAQNQTAPETSTQFLPLLQAVTLQQAAITENQTLIEGSLARLQEDLRQARIYSARSGKRNSSAQ